MSDSIHGRGWLLWLLLLSGCASLQSTDPDRSAGAATGAQGSAAAGAPIEPPADSPQPTAEAAEPAAGALAPTAGGSTEPAASTRVADVRAQRLRVAAVGDMMLGTDFPRNTLPDDDGHSFLSGATPLLSAANVAFGNLEGVLQDGGEPLKQCLGKGNCYAFRSPTRYAKHLKAAGFDVLSLANNHARDFGEAGRDSSMQALDAEGLLHSGREGTHASWTVDNLRLAMIAFAPNPGANPLLDLETARARVSELAATHDVVMVSFHAGAEGEGAEVLPFAREIYLGEDRGNVVEFARAVVEAGADLVIGHGPHLLRAVELFNDRLIAYSLGNFATYYGISVAENRGLAPVLDVMLDGEGRFVEGQIHSLRQLRPGGPVPDETAAAAREIGRLTRAAFPAGALQVDAAGMIRVDSGGAQRDDPASVLNSAPAASTN